jgi:transcriptional regulator with XRE-family HTH domain
MRRNEVAMLIEARAAARSGHAARVRTAADLTQAEVARLVGVTPAAVSLWESGSRRPRGEAALRWARLLRDLEQIATGDGGAIDDAPHASA